MKTRLKMLIARFDALQPRERALLAAAVLGGIVLIGSAGFIEPVIAVARKNERTAQDQQKQLASLEAQLAQLKAPESGPDVKARAELAGLKRQLESLSGRLQKMENTLVPPQQIAGLLEEMIGRRSGLRLLSLKTLPVAPLLDKKEDTATAAKGRSDGPAAGLYKHGVEIRLEGSYQDLAAYLQRLEQAKLKLLWSQAALAAEKHPRLVLTLTVYTLSLDRTWLIV